MALAVGTCAINAEPPLALAICLQIDTISCLTSTGSQLFSFPFESQMLQAPEAMHPYTVNTIGIHTTTLHAWIPTFHLPLLSWFYTQLKLRSVPEPHPLFSGSRSSSDDGCLTDGTQLDYRRRQPFSYRSFSNAAPGVPRPYCCDSQSASLLDTLTTSGSDNR